MRHGPAEAHPASGLDSDRGLTASGRDRVRAVAKVLAEGDEAPAHIATSPLVRAVQTAEIIGLVTRRDEPSEMIEVRRELSPEGNALAWVRTLADAGRKRVMLVGHEPDMSALTSALLGGGFDRGFDKAMVVALHIPVEARNAQLRFVLDPRDLKIRPGG